MTILRLLPCALAALLCTGADAAKRAFTIEDLYRIRQVENLVLSPDGTSVVFTVTTRDLAKGQSAGHLWMMSVEGGAPRQLTAHEKGESSPAFSPDGKQLAFISTRDGDANLYLLPLDGGEPRKLTSIS